MKFWARCWTLDGGWIFSISRFDGVPQLMSRIADDPALGKMLSSNHVTKDTPPTLALFGTADRLKPQGDELLRRAHDPVPLGLGQGSLSAGGRV